VFKAKVGVSPVKLIDEGMCFVCGRRNPIGLKVDFDIDRVNLRITGRFIPRREHQGYGGIMHGGLVSTLLDEAMVKLLWEAGTPAVSASLEIRLIRPARVGNPVIITGWVDHKKGRVIHTGAKLEDSEGAVLAEATGKCVMVSSKEERGAESK
jgi:acyl-coenzyme A thioesterase PaaI-like protein